MIQASCRHAESSWRTTSVGAAILECTFRHEDRDESEADGVDEDGGKFWIFDMDFFDFIFDQSGKVQLYCPFDYFASNFESRLKDELDSLRLWIGHC